MGRRRITHPYSGNRIQKIASGANEDDYNWTEVLMSKAGGQLQGFSLHFYTLPGKWEHKGSATSFGEDEWYSTLVRTLRMDKLIQKHGAIMNKYDPQKPVGLIVDEWGTWYDSEPGKSLAILYQQNSIRDAIVAGINLNIFNQHSDRVQMANIAQTINVLQAMILTDKERMILTPTFDKPDAIRPVRFTGLKVEGDRILLHLPSKSVMVLNP